MKVGRVAGVVVVGLVFAAACSDSASKGAEPTDAPNVPTTAPPATVESAPTSTAEAVAATVPAGVNWIVSSITPPTDAAPVLPSFEAVTATAGVPAAPAGYPFRQSDYISQVFDLGDVQLATGSCGCWEGGGNSGVFGGLRTPVYLFRSADAGATWAQVDLSGVLGDVNGQIDTIVEHDGGLTLTATTSDNAGSTPSVIQVLRSTDGLAWERAGTIAADAGSPGSVDGFDLYSLGSSLVLYGADRVCDFDGSSSIQSIGPTYQTRLWTSGDGGVSWTAQSGSDTGLDGSRPPLPDPAQCAGLDLQTISSTYSSAPRLIRLVDGRLMIWSADGQRIVTTSDGTNWATANLEGAIAEPSEAVAAPEANSAAATILSVDGQFVALNLEEHRKIDGRAGGGTGQTVVTWTSVDGEQWDLQPFGRPILVSDFAARYEFFTADGRLGLRAFDPSAGTDIAIFESVAGDVEDWANCVPVANANCAFADVVGDIPPGADLSGIELSFASLEGRDLTDVSLANAHLRSTNLAGAVFDGTNFDGARLEFVDLVGDLTTATFAGATLDRVRFDESFLSTPPVGATIVSPQITLGAAGLPSGVSLVGRDLTDYTFSNGTLAGVDFSGADLTGASFSYLDLTGAIFTTAVLDGIFFYEVTCPDGQPTSPGAFGAASCRL